LLDINLPDGNGTRLARLVRKNHMLVPILVISGNSGIDVFICKLRRKLVDAGADGLSIDTIWGQGYVLRETRNYAALEKTA
jgi:DNA-binding response OmpR family regulator